MSDIIINEYQELLLKKNQIEQTLPYLPDGYISVKNINFNIKLPAFIG
jgi:hypothetical protein